MTGSAGACTVGGSGDAVIGVDVGSTSVRAGLFTLDGRLLGRAVCPIATSRPLADVVEQDSANIWQSVCAAVRGAVAESGVAAERVVGIAYDATCSLVVRQADGTKIGVTPVGAGSGQTDPDQWDTIVWMDHRAIAQAEECSATGAEVLRFLGGRMSPEMEIPKLMWLKRHRPDAWARSGLIFDLADYLSWMSTGRNERSVCTLTCKWTYLAHADQPWDRAFLVQVGLEDFFERTGVPDRALPIGAAIGPLTGAAADALGLTTRCVVAAGLIDAHAGALGTLGAHLGESIDNRIALIAGTSSCNMGLTTVPRFIPGVWGPYCGAVCDGFHLSEGGQSATGALLDHIVEGHPARAAFGPKPHDAIGAILHARITQAQGTALAPRLHVLPDFHGNRSPLADPNAVGVISGLTLDRSAESLLDLYWATAAAIAYGVRHIIDRMNEAGYAIDTIHLSGGHAANPFLVTLYADACGCAIARSACPEPVLLGTAIAAAAGAGRYDGLAAAARAMAADDALLHPAPQARAMHDQRYAVFLAMHRHRQELDRLTTDPMTTEPMTAAPAA
ncbi:FGGY-family carbohydrate kinase [Azospirillum griseum]|uniref:Ribulokinase n=1 Tax=Azospirillum griseum TaxID=2496639 RepID=A0A3S0K426_9PROT|nr:FGGY-family carbohydrate kinase [Azospirillum griseum]RTR18897.1 ribulokinase [Azospirillum griseum]